MDGFGVFYCVLSCVCVLYCVFKFYKGVYIAHAKHTPPPPPPPPPPAKPHNIPQQIRMCQVNMTLQRQPPRPPILQHPHQHIHQPPLALIHLLQKPPTVHQAHQLGEQWVSHSRMFIVGAYPPTHFGHEFGDFSKPTVTSLAIKGGPVTPGGAWEVVGSGGRR